MRLHGDWSGPLIIPHYLTWGTSEADVEATTWVQFSAVQLLSCV